MDALRVVHPVVLVQRADSLHLRLGELELGDLEVLRETCGVVGLGDDGEALLEGPAEEDLGLGYIDKEGGQRVSTD